MKRFSLVALLLSPSLLIAGDWPQFRGPNGQGFAIEKNLPEKFSKTEGMRWTAALPGRGLSSPVVIGDQVYLTAASGVRGDRLHVICYSLATGKELWHRQLWATGSTVCHPDTNMAAPTPVADKEGVYALFATGDLAAFDLDGNLKWYRSLVGDYPEITNQVGMASSPVLHRGSLIVPMDNAGDSFLAAVDTRYGKNLWKVDRPKDINWVTPLIREVGEKTELIFSTDSALTAYDIATGKIVWTFAGQGVNTIPSSFIGGDKIFVPLNGLTALEFKEGQPKTVWASAQLSTGMSSAVFYDGKVYAMNRAGVLVCADAKDGKVVWQERLKGKFSSSPIAGDGKIYAGNEDGTVFVVKVGDTAEIVGENKIGGRIQATPAISQGVVLYRTDSTLFCIGK